MPRVVGSKGACAILGIDKMSLHRWMKPGSGNDESCQGPDRTYMITPLRVGDGGDVDDGWPIWVREDVERFAVEIGRMRAPAGQAKPRKSARKRDPESLREQIAQLEAQLQAAEAAEDAANKA